MQHRQALNYVIRMVGVKRQNCSGDVVYRYCMTAQVCSARRGEEERDDKGCEGERRSQGPGGTGGMVVGW